MGKEGPSNPGKVGGGGETKSLLLFARYMYSPGHLNMHIEKIQIAPKWVIIYRWRIINKISVMSF